MILAFIKTDKTGQPTGFPEKILSGEKIHSLRHGQRWAAGMEIHMATGVRTKNYNQFNQDRPDLKKCTAVQEIKFMQMKELGMAWILVDGIRMSAKDNEDLARNDGFENFLELCRWFPEPDDFPTQIVHWTNVRYHKPIYTQEIQEDVLEPEITDKQVSNELSPEKVIDAVVQIINETELIKSRVQEMVLPSKIHCNCRRIEYVESRRIASVIMQFMLGYSPSDIGRNFFVKDHATILHNTQKFKSFIETDKNYPLMVCRIFDKLRLNYEDRASIINMLWPKTWAKNCFLLFNLQ